MSGAENPWRVEGPSQATHELSIEELFRAVTECSHGKLSRMSSQWKGEAAIMPRILLSPVTKLR